MNQSIFSIRGLDTSTELLGLWQPEPEGALAFDTPGRESEAEIVWTVSLPAEPEQGGRLLEAGRRSLGAARRETARAGATLERLPTHWLDGESVRAYGLGEADAAPEPGLAALRGNLQRLQRGETDLLAYDYSLADSWNETVAAYQRFIAETNRLLRPTLVTETQRSGRSLAITRLELTGDVATTWRGRQSRAQVALHRQAVTLSSQSRLALLQLLGQVSAGGAILAAKFSLGSPLVAMPAAWRYLQDVIHQTRAVSSLVSPRIPVERGREEQ